MPPLLPPTLLCLALLCLPTAAVAQQRQAGGTISGRVTYGGVAPRPAKLMVVADVAVCSVREHYDDRLQVNGQGIKDAVVSLVGIQGSGSLAGMGDRFVLDQRGCAYQPHVLLVPVRAPVKILNSDQVFHNVHTFSVRNQPLNLAQPASRKKLTLSFSAPERIAVRCDVHGWMSAWIIAVDHPYHAVTDAEGRFAIAGVPPGTYTVNCWQELLGEQTATVKVAAGAQAGMDFAYPAK